MTSQTQTSVSIFVLQLNFAVKPKFNSSSKKLNPVRSDNSHTLFHTLFFKLPTGGKSSSNLVCIKDFEKQTN